MQCQIMMPNSMQCKNNAFASYKGTEMCLTHFNFKMGDLTTEKRHIADEDVKLLTGNDEDQIMLNRIVVFTNESIDGTATRKA